MIALCDMRSFYCACEKVFRPDIRDGGVVVTSNNDGIVVALDDKAKAVGVRKFEPFFQQRSLIQAAGVRAFSSNYELYGEISARIMATLENLVPNAIEIYSIDECFIDCNHIPRKQLKTFGAMLRDTIWKQQGIKMGVSIAPTKTLAKLGQCATKQYSQINGVCVLEHQYQWQWLAERVKIGEVWGIGRQLTKKLTAIGLKMAADLAVMNEVDAQALQGITLVQTVRELKGVLCIAMACQSKAKQEIISSRSFGQKQTDLKVLQEAVSHYAVRTGIKLRKQKSVCFCLSVWIETSKYDKKSYTGKLSVSLPGGTDDSRVLSKAAVAIVDNIFRPGYRYTKAGVVLHHIQPKSFSQQDILVAQVKNSTQLMKLVDKVNQRFGANSIKLARQGGKANFAMRRAMKSPDYLTRWSDIPRIKIK